MQLTIFAATGRIGRHLVTQALDAGHQVVAVARNPVDLPAAVRTVRVDLAAPDLGAIKSAVRGSDAALSALGPRTKADSGITTPGTRPIIEAAVAEGVDRLIVVSAAPVGTVPSPGRPHPPKHDPGDGPVMRFVLSPLVKAAFKEHYRDLARMEDLLRDSGLNWTAVRPPRLSDKPLSGHYQVAYGRNIRGGVIVGRADVAHLMLRLIDDEQSFRHTVGLAS
jgi:putative NADH-flavin reductase